METRIPWIYHSWGKSIAIPTYSRKEFTRVPEVFNVDDQGERQPTDVVFQDFKKDQVYLVVDHDSRKIFVWKGPQSPVRRKFTSARAASSLRMELGMTYKIDSLDAGIEGREFLALYGETPPEKPVEAPATPARDAVEPSTPIAPSVARSAPPPTGGPVVTARPAVKPRTAPTKTAAPQPAPARAPARAPATAPAPQPAPAATAAPRIAKPHEVSVTTEAPKGYKPRASFSLKQVEEKLKELSEPPDMIREIVIVGDTVFSVIKEYLPLFDKEVVKLEAMTDLPEGAFPASDYESRILIGAGGKVMFIELLRPAPESERDEFVSEMKRSLKDLTKLGI
ncbi:MAG: hypothetical protein ACFFGZ_08030 [Candidatus Thorarchaeota archaeon]